MLIPCSISPPEPSSTVTWISGCYEQSCQILRYKLFGGIPCAYIGYLDDDGEVLKAKGEAIVFVSQLFISPAEIQFMAQSESFH